jgi:transcriptional regulator with XRE-family HTH domain
MLNYDDIVIRIKKVIEDHELNAASFAEKIGVQRSGISHILSGRNKPSLEFLSKIQTTFDEIEYDWLLLGKNQQVDTLPSTLFDDVEEKVEKEQLSIPNIQSQKPTEFRSEGSLKEIIYVYDDDSFKVIQRKS